ncbi:hypothetical protein L210DRAFT_3755602 [Boletus edulis BED1]|uniref:Uncharacterized protein n=1 Tax=Boletus edulis BED1 TaxID=1328754 RepID=A0AAD4GNB1_BOLED|nr:hypothetical protein L210DRAFT_3755602 [Boletus edulis BED1]
MVFGPAGEVALTLLASEPFAQALSLVHGSVESFVAPTTPLPELRLQIEAPSQLSFPGFSSITCLQACEGVPPTLAALPLAIRHSLDRSASRLPASRALIHSQLPQPSVSPKIERYPIATGG